MKAQKFVQLMPAARWWVEWKNEDGTELEGRKRVVAFALTKSGKVVGLVSRAHGLEPAEKQRFANYFYK
jgi:hypothetical protein